MGARHEASRSLVAARLGGFLILSLTATAIGLRTAQAASGQLELTVVDRQTKQPIACRMHLRTAKGRP